MNEQLEVQRTEEQQEIIDLNKEIQTHKEEVQLGEDMLILQKSPQFQRLFEKLFLEDGTKYLWENIQHFEEVLMDDRLSTDKEKIERSIRKMREQVAARRVLRSFIDTVLDDMEIGRDALTDLYNIDEKEENTDA